MYTKVSSVNFHMSYFHMFCFLAKKKDFSSQRTPKVLGKEGENAQESKSSVQTKQARKSKKTGKLRDAPDTFNFLRHVMRAIWSVRPKCSHRCVSLKETPLKLVQILKRRTFYSAEQTAMRTKWFKHIAI